MQTTLEGALAWLGDRFAFDGSGAVHDAVGALAACLPDAAGPDAELRALADHVGRSLHVCSPQNEAHGYDDLRPDRALLRLEGCELLVAALLAAIGQRRGYDVFVARGRRHTLVAHDRLEGRLVLSPRHQSRVMAASAFEPGITWCSPAEVVATLLARLHERALRVGDERARAMLAGLPAFGTDGRLVAGPTSWPAATFA